MKKIIPIIFISVVLLQLASCSGDTNPATENTLPETTAELQETEAQPEVTDRSQKSDSLPELDFEGQEINFIIRPEMAKYDATGESGGDLVFDAVFNRNITVEERLNVKLNFIMAGEHFDEMAKQVETAVLSGDSTYDVIQQRSLQTFNQSLEGMFVDLSDAPYIDLDQPWWWTDIIRDTSINTNKLYYLTGDLSLSTFQASTVCYVNTNMLTNFGHDMNDIYDAVESGEWTWDVFKTYCAGVYTDANGNGESDDEDIHPFSYYPASHHWFTYSSGLKYTSRDDDGYPVLNINNDETVRLLETLVDVWHSNNNGYFVNDKFNIMVQRFVDEKNLFCMGRFTHSDIIRNMESSFSMAPYPKLDAKYDYMSGTGASGNFISIPVTSNNFETSCAVLEAMSAENYRKVFPAYYEIALKIKYASDNRDAQMVDIVYDSIYVDFTNIASIPTIIDALVFKNSTSFASEYSSQESTINSTVEKMIEKFESIN